MIGKVGVIARKQKNRVSTKSQIDADSVSSGKCVKSKMLQFLRKNAWFWRKPSKDRAKNRGFESPLRHQVLSVIRNAFRLHVNA